MQVSQIAELDTHAVLGGQSAQSFFMSDSPEFFSILSDQLYRDKKLAVVREVICNAHDAHVMGKCLTKPIEITVTEEELKIRDFGPGIHHDRMHSVYCGYGVSTKVDDATQIGGFGLGCKAPFAYSDHFTVTSCHAGVRSVYAVSRGGVETKGKPSMRRMTNVPTEESGIEVSIPIKNRNDRVEFERLVRQVVRNGGMCATLNGLPMTRMDFSGLEKAGYGWVHTDQLHESHVYVRLGAVLYPLTTDDPKLTKLVQTFTNGSGMRIILQARPGEVGVTPSRESLSYSEQTVTNLTERLTRVIGQIKHQMPVAMRFWVETHVNKSKDPVLNIWFKVIRVSPSSTVLSDPLAIAKDIFALVREPYSNQLGVFYEAAGNLRNALFKAAMKKYRDYRRLFRRAKNMNAKNNLDRFNFGHNDWKVESGKHLYRVAGRLGILDHLSRAVRTASEKSLNVQPIRKCADAFTCKPSVVIVRSRTQASAYLTGKGYSSNDKTVFLTVRHMKPEEISRIKKALEDQNFEVVTLDIAKPAPKPKAVKVEPAKQFYYQLADVAIHSQEPSVVTSSRMIEHAPVFINCSTLLEYNKFRHEPRQIVLLKKKILAVYPTVVLAIGAHQKKALVEAGSRDITEVFEEDFLKITVTPEELFAVGASRGFLFGSTDDGYTPIGVANTFSKLDLRFAKLFAGQPVGVSANEEKVYRLVQLHAAGILTPVKNEKAREHQDLLTKKIPNLKQTDLSYLRPICDLSGHRYDHEIKWSDDIADMIRFLQKRATKLNLIHQPLKEAA